MFPTTLPDQARALVIVLATVAGIIDLRYRRIPNWLTFSALVAGFALRGWVQGIPGIAAAAKGLGLALAVYVPLWLLRGVGAGDVKLMAATGSIAGPGAWLLIFAVSSMVGGITGLAMAARRGVLLRTLRNTAILAGQLLRLRRPWQDHPNLDVRHEQSLRMPHGAIIASAVLLLALARLI